MVIWSVNEIILHRVSWNKNTFRCAAPSPLRDTREADDDDGDEENITECAINNVNSKPSLNSNILNGPCGYWDLRRAAVDALIRRANLSGSSFVRAYLFDYRRIFDSNGKPSHTKRRVSSRNDHSLSFRVVLVLLRRSLCGREPATSTKMFQLIKRLPLPHFGWSPFALFACPYWPYLHSLKLRF